MLALHISYERKLREEARPDDCCSCQTSFLLLSASEALHLLHKGGVRLELMPRRISREGKHLVTKDRVAHLRDQDAKRNGHVHRRARHRPRDVGHAHQARETHRSACSDGHGLRCQGLCRHAQRGNAGAQLRGCINGLRVLQWRCCLRKLGLSGSTCSRSPWRTQRRRSRGRRA